MDYASLLTGARDASRALADMPDATVSEALKTLAALLVARADEILAANTLDLATMPTEDPRYDRLLLTSERIAGIARDCEVVATLPSPLGRLLDERTRPNGLLLRKISVPIGVVGVVYEARPNVTVDAAALCLKSGNACVLKGGSDAVHSNEAIVAIVHEALKKHGIDERAVTLLPSDRSAVEALLAATDTVDVVIPRGSRALIDFVRSRARVPVIETGAGVVHTYLDSSADLALSQAIVCNEKTYRPSVCNALDTLLVHRSLLDALGEIVEPLAAKKVEIFADADALAALQGSYDSALLHRASPEHFGTEFLSLTMSIKTVGSLDEALAHIAAHGSRHSEGIVATDEGVVESFLRRVDAAVVYANAATTFSDGAQFGMGGEIGISTQKLHARGPVGIDELTSYKWIALGNGQIRD